MFVLFSVQSTCLSLKEAYCGIISFPHRERKGEKKLGRDEHKSSKKKIVLKRHTSCAHIIKNKKKKGGKMLAAKG